VVGPPLYPCVLEVLDAAGGYVLDDAAEKLLAR
jgi:hypothetical protein